MRPNAAIASLRTTVGAVVGRTGALFGNLGPVHEATLSIDDTADAPGSTKLLKPGTSHDVLVRCGVVDADPNMIRSLCIKVPDLYGSGRDQDLLLASSADGAPGHHVALPVAETEPALYSSMWLYLAGIMPVLFGVKTDTAAVCAGTLAAFCISPPIGKFRPVGTLRVGDELPDTADCNFAARNTGGNIRALPPVLFY